MLLVYLLQVTNKDELKLSCCLCCYTCCDVTAQQMSSPSGDLPCSYPAPSGNHLPLSQPISVPPSTLPKLTVSDLLGYSSHPILDFYHAGRPRRWPGLPFIKVNDMLSQHSLAGSPSLVNSVSAVTRFRHAVSCGIMTFRRARTRRTWWWPTPRPCRRRSAPAPRRSRAHSRARSVIMPTLTSRELDNRS